MASCREVDPLVTPYLDGEATAAEREIVAGHLDACPPCRHRAAAEAAARETVRMRLCRPCAPEQLRARCLAAARARSFGLPRVTFVSVSLAAALVLLLGGVLVYALTGLSPAVLAAQLTADHVACFAVHASDAPVDVAASETEFARDHGWNVDVPQPALAGLQFVGLRQCYCAKGAAAHAMYRLNGRPVSLYIIPDADGALGPADVLGHDAIMWSSRDRTYVLLSRDRRETLERLATQMMAAP